MAVSDQLGIGLHVFLVDKHLYPARFADASSDNPGTWRDQLERGGLGVSVPEPTYWEKGVWKCPSVRWNFPASEIPA